MPIRRLLVKWKTSLMWKLVSIFVAIVLCNLLVIGYFVNKQVTTAIESDDTKFSSLVLRQANLNLIRYLQDYEHFLMTLGTSLELQSWTDLSANKRAESIVPYSIIERDYIRPFFNSHPEFVSISFYNKSGNEISYSPKYGIRIGYSMGKEPWINDIPAAGNIQFLVKQSAMYSNTDLTDIQFPVISMVKRFGYNGSTFVKIDIMPTLLQNILNEINLGENGIGLIVDNNGVIIAHPQRNQFLAKLDPNITSRITGSSKGAFVLNQPKEIVIYESIDSTKWKSVIIIPYRDIAGSIYSIRNMMLVTTTLCLIISSLLIFFISSSFTRRLTTIRQTIKQTGQGQIDVPVPVEGHDEISSLAVSYNAMLEDLQLHIRRLAESKLVEQQSVLFSLQSQIDAHFLYNTLEIINSMASKIQHKEIERITVSLAHMFRYTANYKQTEVTVRDEVQHLQRYFQIIKIRYADHFNYDLDVEEACLDAKCLKVILQPIAENAVKHGYETTGRPLHISIKIALTGNENKYIEVTVADNGKGFDHHKLDELKKELEGSNPEHSRFQRIGLLNIHYRLITKYNTTVSGIQIENHSGGAEVKLTFPYET